MCFVLDAEWYASVSEESEYPATKPIRCDECRRRIEVGQTVHHLHQQEHEACRVCDQYERAEHDDEYDGESPLTPCPEGECQFGETFEYDTCHDCHRFLEAVSAAEIAAGCSASESRPYLTQMIGDIGEGGKEEAEKYFVKAREMFPDMQESGYLTWLWEKMFGE